MHKMTLNCLTVPESKEALQTKRENDSGYIRGRKESLSKPQMAKGQTNLMFSK